MFDFSRKGMLPKRGYERVRIEFERIHWRASADGWIEGRVWSGGPSYELSENRATFTSTTVIAIDDVPDQELAERFCEEVARIWQFPIVLFDEDAKEAA
ncbi:hypothetical protein B5E41_30340 [Rhizobium esperanzae]|uniref:Uncharacterized protein n=1 Tax=Rhizobium esperanzae TaxID=1967781 RepID=A0A246DKP1_9HYPH|nr:hypothetical protein [Rhizobium esperanzae]OWO89544.1 hypothetical protein B5E41_30340 [Rhizobium esperanzae]